MTTSMYLHHEYKSRDSRSSSKFTVHAAVELQRRHNLRNEYVAADQLLEELNVKQSQELKNLVHDTFPTMYGMYLLRKEEMRLTHVGYSDKELILYHVTTKSRALESLKRGLNWRRIRRSKFGRGVSFSDDADYANYYADNSLKEDSRVIIVCAVLVNKTHRVSSKHNGKNLVVPPGCADTTVSPNGRVYVKYNDYDFYPLYFMHYQRTSENLSESKYFLNNPHNKWHQNNLIMQQQRDREQAQNLQAQREREQAQLEFSRKSQQELQKQRERSQKPQAKQEGEQSQVEFLRKLQQELQKQRERDQSQNPQAKQEGEQSQVEFLRKLQQELQARREREQAQREQELMTQRERMREWRQQELREQREREQAQREQELMAQRERMREWRQQELREQREQEQRDEVRQPLLEQTHREYAQQREVNTKLCCLIL